MNHHYIIDGYNVLHRIETFRIQMVQSLEKGRSALITRVSAFQARHRADVTVVFDGDHLSGVQPSAAGLVRIQYSRSPRKADDVIKRLIDQSSHKSDMTVVSSDMEVMHYAKASGCRTLSSEQFFSMLSAKAKQDNDPDLGKKGDPQLSRSEINGWIDLFNSDRRDDDDT